MMDIPKERELAKLKQTVLDNYCDKIPITDLLWAESSKDEEELVKRLKTIEVKQYERRNINS